MKRFSLLILVAAAMLASWAAGTPRYTVVVSLDGFRWDYCEAFDTPFLNSMARRGVKAVMSPSFPSKTFPNHYTLATGLYPDHHGIVANSFLSPVTGRRYALTDSVERTNPRYYGGDPIWLTAKRQGLVTATVYWVGSDVAIKGEHATYWHDYMSKSLLTPAQRVDEVVRLLSLPAGERPRLVMCYFEEPDHSGHRYGPMSRPTRLAVQQLDTLLSRLWARIQASPCAGQVNLIVTGDHGMTWIDSDRLVPVKQHLKPAWVKAVEGDLPGFIYVNRPDYADSVLLALGHVDHIRAFKRSDLPAYLHFGTNPAIGDVVVIPDVGWLYTDKHYPAHVQGGSHGYDNTASDMQVGFRAMGPDFKVGYTKPSRFPNVDVYPLLCRLLGITPSPNDGNLDEVADMLR